MSISHIGRKKSKDGRKRGHDWYRYKCDVDGCDNYRTFHCNNAERIRNWKKAVKYDENNTVEEVRHICPRCKNTT